MRAEIDISQIAFQIDSLPKEEMNPLIMMSNVNSELINDFLGNRSEIDGRSNIMNT